MVLLATLRILVYGTARGTAGLRCRLYYGTSQRQNQSKRVLQRLQACTCSGVGKGLNAVEFSTQRNLDQLRRQTIERASTVCYKFNFLTTRQGLGKRCPTRQTAIASCRP